MCIITDDEIKKQFSSPQRMKVLSTYKRISLWLIPPEPVLSSLAQTQLQLIEFHDSSSNNNMSFLNNGEKKKRLPTFVPHVTLVGGIPISECYCTDQDNIMSFVPSNNNIGRNYRKGKQDSSSDIDEVAAQNVLRRLACAFDNFGGVDCTFVKDRGVFAARRRMNDDDDDDEEGEVQWNQSCISIMERTHTFTKAMELAEQTLFTKQSSSASATLHSSSLERHFKPPACEPHYSFVYGNDADLISSLQSSSDQSFHNTSFDSTGGTNKVVLECPPNFTSTEIAVVWTYPSSLEGVRQWREIGRFSLVENKSKY